MVHIHILCSQDLKKSSNAQINSQVVSFLQGFSTTSQEVGTTVLPGLPGANPHRPACPESGLCNAGVHTVWVCIHKTPHPYISDLIYSITIYLFICSAFFLQWSASVWRFIADSWMG